MNRNWIPNIIPEIKEEMLKVLGIKDVEELFTDIPQEIKLERSLDLPPPVCEQEALKEIKKILSKNLTFEDIPIFLGSGVWPHHLPSAVSNVVERSEFLTSYTSYQAEISQGMLQGLWEYQSLICELTGMDVANASMYDWASSLGEAALMAARLTKRRRILVPQAIHPDRLSTLLNYVSGVGLQIQTVPYNRLKGALDVEKLEELLGEDVAAVYVEQPNFFGVIEEEVEEIGKLGHEKGALFIVGVDVTSLGLLRAPGDYGADIVVGEGQPFGNPASFGGPLLGIFACKYDPKTVRSMPGRIAGWTTVKDREEKAFCLTLQTREQHIRREKATSNICSNEALCALAATVHIALLGPEGLKRWGEICMSNAHYAMERIDEIEGFKAPIFEGVHFREFVVKCDIPNVLMKDIHKELLKLGVHGGKIITEYFPELGDAAVYSATEMHSREDIDQLIDSLEKVVKKEKSAS